MLFAKKTLLLTTLTALCLAPSAYAGDNHVAAKPESKAPMPRARQALPPSLAQQKFNLPPTHKPRTDLMPPQSRNNPAQRSAKLLTTTPDCQDMNKLASYSGSALADYIVNLPDYECHYGLFSLNATQAATVYSAGNFTAVANRFVQEASSYNATNIALVNLLIYLRAGYYLSDGTIPAPSPSLVALLRPAIKQLVDNTTLFQSNAAGPSTAGETLRLITNMHDEAYYLPSVKNIVARYTNTPSNPNAAQGLRQQSAADGFTGALTVLFYAHSRADGLPLLQNDLSYPTALDNFIVNDKAALMGTETAYQLTDTANEAFRFMQYPSLKPGVAPMVQQVLSTSSMTGADNDLWLAAASAVKYYDNANCANYGTCGFETKLADALLNNKYTCSPTIRIRSQELTIAQMQTSCTLLQTEEGYFHDMLQTNRTPVADDNNTSLEVVVFSDYTNYNKYASVIYGINTNNGGMYLEGEPNVPGNQARFIAHEASWLRPVFEVWNLKHEYVHYLDGRFDMYGDFALETQQPTVWWLEGLAEYISKKNDNQASIDLARTGAYKLSEIYGNTYSMANYVPRAYNWGYMATRFMFERHRSDIDAILPKFRVGDYSGYENMMVNIGTHYDAEFASWVQAATTAGDPPLPDGPALPACPSSSYLGKNCSITGWTSSGQAYAYIMLPNGAKNLRIYTSGGTGDEDMYIAMDRYPTTSSYDAASINPGNRESISLLAPTAGHWYYIVLNAKQPFSGVTLSATYD